VAERAYKGKEERGRKRTSTEGSKGNGRLKGRMESGTKRNSKKSKRGGLQSSFDRTITESGQNRRESESM